ncbi:MAG: D-alanine--D-alanine ligase [Microvirga sp.]|nr:D-alanine--D-alanine ligase [Microvirga sp.]
MSKKVRVAILAGGFSSERDVSLRSGEMARRNLDPERYVAEVIDLKDLLPPASLTWADLKARCDVVFIALHGEGGEDGTLQGALELLDMPYTGSGVYASALAMNKRRTKEVYQANGIPTADALAFDLRYAPLPDVHDAARAAETRFGFPLVLKADNQGSSFGVYIVRNAAEFEDAWKGAATFSPEILIERFVPGTEVTCGVIGGQTLQALPIVEIVPAGEWFDFEAKYTPGAAEEIVPARISPELTQKVQELAVKAHKALGCWGMSRTDMRITPAGEIFVLETNTIPGLTEGSLLPKEARAAGLMLPELFDRLITFALARHASRRALGSTAR